jgi:outer membrane protein assembly factor BamD (BamD/ComL family)
MEFDENNDLKTRYTLACNYTNAQPKDEAEQKTYSKGMEIFQDLVDNYPNSELAPKAKEKLDALTAAALKSKPTTTPAAN